MVCCFLNMKEAGNGVRGSLSGALACDVDKNNYHVHFSLHAHLGRQKELMMLLRTLTGTEGVSYVAVYMERPFVVFTFLRQVLLTKMEIPEVLLSSGQKMPLLGMGTATFPRPPPHQVTSILVDAIKVGYRHFDSAAVYASEEPLGRAVTEAIERGLIKSRSELFITSKLWCTDNHPDLVLPALKNTLQKLGMEYVDLYLVHWPVRLRKEAPIFEFSGEDVIPWDMKGTWAAMEECCRLGLARSIGVSNFSSKKLSQLLQHATIPPAVNQVEMNPAWHHVKLRGFCKEKGIHVTAWSPLGANGAFWGSLAVVDNPILKEISTAKGKSLAQVSLRWLHQQGVSIVVKSFNKERMKENLKIFDWELTDNELAKIKQILQHRGCPGQSFVHHDGPYKSLEELWDDDA